MPSAKVSRANGSKTERKKRELAVTLDDFDGTQLSQGSSDDGFVDELPSICAFALNLTCRMMAVIAQQMQGELLASALALKVFLDYLCLTTPSFPGQEEKGQRGKVPSSNANRAISNCNISLLTSRGLLC